MTDERDKAPAIEHAAPRLVNACKRCGKPCPTRSHEYCGAACSERRKQTYPQPDEIERMNSVDDIAGETVSVWDD